MSKAGSRIIDIFDDMKGNCSFFKVFDLSYAVDVGLRLGSVSVVRQAISSMMSLPFTDKEKTMRHIKSEERGSASHGWLESKHSFSFGDYFDAERMGFGALRVINEDRVAPGRGFGEHGRRDMEIISYVLSGSLEHRDSLGSGSVAGPGEAQRMSVGGGVRHSEFNASRTQPVHFLQIWIEPSFRGLAPSYEKKVFSEASKRGRLRLIASEDGREESMTIHQNASVYAGLLDGAERFELELAAGRRAYAHAARGRAWVNGVLLEAGDALEMENETRIVADRGEAAELLIFDLP